MQATSEAQPRVRELLRVATVGSVDDGKSTLVGRLLHDTARVPEDQRAAAGVASVRHGLAASDAGYHLALLTDGLRAEREQGITIDVAYRYFATVDRSFVLADTPGHVQYTRNTVTGASTADVAVVLVDARTGLVEQTRRHVAVAGLLRVPVVVFAVNKMDLVGFDPDVFGEIERAARKVAARVDVARVHTIPMSALHGDNVARPEVAGVNRMGWYTGPTLLDLLTGLRVDGGTSAGLRLPVQLVVRPATGAGDHRGYAGRVASGEVRVGDEIVVLPAGRRTVVTAVDTPTGPVRVAGPGRSVVLRVADDVDIARGDLIAHPGDAPQPRDELAITGCVLAERTVAEGDRYRLRTGTRETLAVVSSVDSRLSLGELEPEPVHTLGANDIGALRLRTAEPVVVDPYRVSRATGALLLLDSVTGAPVVGGMVV